MSTPRALSFALVAICVMLSNSQIFDQFSVTAAESHEGRVITDHYLLQEDCSTALNEQISWELYASIVYMNIGAYFNRPTVARLGYGKFFKAQSLEEYGHANKFIEYINLRNGTVKRIALDESPKAEWSSPREALSDAIKLEKHVYAKLRRIHDIADQKCQDPHLADFLETNFFTEQVDSIHQMQVMYSTLDVADETASIIEHLEDKALRKDL